MYNDMYPSLWYPEYFHDPKKSSLLHRKMDRLFLQIMAPESSAFKIL